MYNILTTMGQDTDTELSHLAIIFPYKSAKISLSDYTPHKARIEASTFQV